MKKNAVTRIYCSCGWEKWISFDPKMTNEEIIKLTQPTLNKHLITHGQAPQKLKYAGSERLRFE
jgi:hypothetical protein